MYCPNNIPSLKRSNMYWLTNMSLLKCSNMYWPINMSSQKSSNMYWSTNMSSRIGSNTHWLHQYATKFNMIYKTYWNSYRIVQGMISYKCYCCISNKFVTIFPNKSSSRDVLGDSTTPLGNLKCFYLWADSSIRDTHSECTKLNRSRST